MTLGFGRSSRWLAAAVLVMPLAVHADDHKVDKDKDKDHKVEKQEVHRFAFAGHPGGGYLGVSLDEVSADDLRQLKLEDQGGARVVKVTPDSPAEKAGFREGDVVVRFHGEPVISARQMQRLVQEVPPGRSVKVDVRRDGQPVTVQVTVGEPHHGEMMLGEDFPEHFDPHARTFQFRVPAPEDFGKHADLFFMASPRHLGVHYQEISGQLARYFHLDRDNGLLVTEVEAGSPAEKAGLKAGDVIVSFGGQAVDDGDDLRRSLARSEGGEVTVKVWRDGKPVDVKVNLESRKPSHDSTT
jgi:serine protease Do